jgi:Winged helix DNA-binding domain
VLLEEWVPRSKRLARDEALPELARRYFTGHGPATLRDFAWWSGLTLADARLATDLAGNALEQAAIAGHRYWFAPSAVPVAATGAGERAHALPAFDEFFVGYADRSAAIAPSHAKSITAFDVLGPGIVLDGRLVARWKRRMAGAKVVFSTYPLAPLSRVEGAAVQRALARYARFLGRERGA